MMKYKIELTKILDGIEFPCSRFGGSLGWMIEQLEELAGRTDIVEAVCWVSKNDGYSWKQVVE